MSLPPSYSAALSTLSAEPPGAHSAYRPSAEPGPTYVQDIDREGYTLEVRPRVYQNLQTSDSLVYCFRHGTRDAFGKALQAYVDDVSSDLEDELEDASVQDKFDKFNNLSNVRRDLVRANVPADALKALSELIGRYSAAVESGKQHISTIQRLYGNLDRYVQEFRLSETQRPVRWLKPQDRCDADLRRYINALMARCLEILQPHPQRLHEELQRDRVLAKFHADTRSRW